MTSKTGFAKLGLALACALCVSGLNAFNLSAQDKTINPNPGQERDEVNPDDKPTAAPQDPESKQEKPAPPFSVKVAENAIEFTASGSWKAVPPKSNMIEAEIKVPRLGDDQQDGRLTIMGAGGTIEDNIIRWQKQFAQEDGELAEVKQEVKTIAGQEVHLVDISGTYLDSPGGPFAGGATMEREHYRMLAAIIKTAKNGNYFVKFYGPQHTLEQNKEHFKSMIESLKVEGGSAIPKTDR